MKKYFDLFKNAIRSFIRNHEKLRQLIAIVRGAWHLFRKNMIFRKIKYDGCNKNSGKKVLIFSPRAIPTTDYTYIDALFGHAFKKLGCEAKILYCDCVLDSCDWDSINQDQRIRCFSCKIFSPLVKRVLRLGNLSFKDYINENEIESIKGIVAKLKDTELVDYMYLGVDVGRHAKSATIRYFLEAIINLNDPLIVKILRKKLVNAMIVSKIANEVYNKENPQLIFMLHGIYSTWGPFYRYFRNKNIDVVVFNTRDERFGYAIFNRNACQFDLFAPKIWEKFKQEPLGIEEKKQIDSFLFKRFSGQLLDSLKLYEKYYNKKTDKQLKLSSLHNEKYVRRYVLFSNVFWDAVVEDLGSYLFKDIIVWINKTVEHFLKRPDFQLIIKPHPGELGGATGERTIKGVEKYISEAFPNLTENIHILEADTPLRAYDLISPNMVGLTFNGTLGLELATQGIPVIVAANCHYKEAGVVYNIKSTQEYFHLIDHPEELKLFAQKNIELAKKYAYYYFFKTMVRLPLYLDNRWDTIDWKMISNVDSLFRNDNGFMKIFKDVIDGKDVLD